MIIEDSKLITKGNIIVIITSIVNMLFAIMGSSFRSVIIVIKQLWVIGIIVIAAIDEEVFIFEVMHWDSKHLVKEKGDSEKNL